MPSVFLTPHISPAWHASGRYDPVSNRIFISSSQFFEHDEDTRRYVLLHELGHWFRENHVAKSTIKHGWNLSKEGAEESFADMFALYFNNQRDCKKTYPDHYAFLNGKILGFMMIEIEEFLASVINLLTEKTVCKDVRCLVWEAK